MPVDQFKTHVPVLYPAKLTKVTLSFVGAADVAVLDF